MTDKIPYRKELKTYIWRSFIEKSYYYMRRKEEKWFNSYMGDKIYDIAFGVIYDELYDANHLGLCRQSDRICIHAYDGEKPIDLGCKSISSDWCSIYGLETVQSKYIELSEDKPIPHMVNQANKSLFKRDGSDIQDEHDLDIEIDINDPKWVDVADDLKSYIKTFERLQEASFITTKVLSKYRSIDTLLSDYPFFYDYFPKNRFDFPLTVDIDRLWGTYTKEAIKKPAINNYKPKTKDDQILYSVHGKNVLLDENS